MSSNPSGNQPLMNFNMLKAITNNNTVFTTQLLEAFQTELLDFMNRLKPVLTIEELTSFNRSYHSISPSFKMLGLDLLSEKLDLFRKNSRVLNSSAESADTSAYLEISELMQKVLIELKEYLSDTPTGA